MTAKSGSKTPEEAPTIAEAVRRVCLAHLPRPAARALTRRFATRLPDDIWTSEDPERIRAFAEQARAAIRAGRAYDASSQ
jgi:hypothetical protein